MSKRIKQSLTFKQSVEYLAMSHLTNGDESITFRAILLNKYIL